MSQIIFYELQKKGYFQISDNFCERYHIFSENVDVE